MEQMNLHKSKLYALIVAAVGVIACILPWWHYSFGGFAGIGAASVSINGLHELGIIAFIGFIGAGVVTFVMGDKTKPYEGQVKMIVAACFGVAGLIALIQMLRNMHGLSIGLFLALAAGVIGALWVWGLVKMPDNKPKA